jgi:hypothetical protein
MQEVGNELPAEVGQCTPHLHLGKGPLHSAQVIFLSCESHQHRVQPQRALPCEVLAIWCCSSCALCMVGPFSLVGRTLIAAYPPVAVLIIGTFV